MEALLNERVVSLRSPTKDEIQELKKFVRSVNKRLRVKQHKTVDLTTLRVEYAENDQPDGLGEDYVKVVKWLNDQRWVQFPSGTAGYLGHLKNAPQYNAFYAIGALAFKD